MQDSSIYDNIPLAVCVLRKSRMGNAVLYANAAFAHMAGADNPGQVKGQNFDDVWPDLEASVFLKKLKSVTPPKTYIMPASRVYKTGKRWVSFVITESAWDGEEAFVLWGADISATKEHEEELIAAVEKADAMAEMKSNFLATMSHEIRTPMQTIYGLLELIADERPDERISAMVGTAQSAASGLLEILDDILDLAKDGREQDGARRVRGSGQDARARHPRGAGGEGSRHQCRTERRYRHGCSVRYHRRPKAAAADHHESCG
jgi:two-component system sensor histidine kinase/response regulator